MQRVIETIEEELRELKRDLPPEGYYNEDERGHRHRLRVLSVIEEHEAALRLLKGTGASLPAQVLRYHRLAAAEHSGYGEVVKNATAHWAYGFVENGDLPPHVAGESLQRTAQAFANFEASGQAIAWRVGYSGGFFDGKHNTSEHADNPYEPKVEEG